MTGDKLSATVRTFRHTQDPNIRSVLGRDTVNIQLSGVVRGNTVQCEGTAPEAPGVKFSATLDRISD